MTWSGLGPSVPLCLQMPVVEAGEAFVTGHTCVSLGWAPGVRQSAQV